MTLPTRPAPAPPGSRAQFAAANANASLEQLRLQLQQQQQLQRSQQNVIVPKLTFKLPPPTNKQPATLNNDGTLNNNTNSITRKFPQARYAPATNWDDSPFDILTDSSTGLAGGLPASSQTPAQQLQTNGNFKKQPPPRPPPPKVLVKKSAGAAPTPPIQQSTNILTNIFHLKKKSSKAPTSNYVTTRTLSYGSMRCGSKKPAKVSKKTESLFFTSNPDFDSGWNPIIDYKTNTLINSPQNTAATEAQLISFDSPPSSPTFTQKSNSDCLSVDSFSSDSNFSSPNNGSVSQPESGFEDDFSARSRPATTSPLDPWEALDAFGHPEPVGTTSTAATATATAQQPRYGSIGTAPVRNLSTINTRIQTNSDNPLCNGKSLLPPAPALNMPTIIKPKISQKPKAPKPPPLLAKPPAAAAFASSSSSSSSSIYADNQLATPPSPPMPKCAPPPPPPTTAITTTSTSSFPAPTQKPTILDVITGKVDALQLGSSCDLDANDGEPNAQPYGIALYDFDSTEAGDLCFRENEKIYLLEQVSADWFKGRTRSGCEGIFPVNYIEIKVPLPSSSPAATSAASSTTPTYPNTAATSSELKIRCLYNFPAEVEGDLELKENDLVTILYRINEDWLLGEINGRQGQFPANFLEYVPSCIPTP